MGFWVEEGVLEGVTEGSTGLWLAGGEKVSMGFWLEEGDTAEVLEGSAGFWVEEGVLEGVTEGSAGLWVEVRIGSIASLEGEGVGVQVGRIFMIQLRLLAVSSRSNPAGQGAERIGYCFKQII
jgi:hypothetical protein